MVGVWREYSEELEFELLRMGVDVLTANNPDSGLTLRRLYVLYENLPLKNAIHHAALGTKPGDKDFWVTEHVLADVFDAVQFLSYITQKANSPKGASIKPPKPYPRPGSQVKRKPAPIRKIFPGRVIIDGSGNNPSPQ